jgi:D-3-phosphoglycerate dehydrogenase
MRVAELAKVFGCNVIAYSRTKKAEAEKLGIKYVSLDELMRTSDIVSVHIPLNDSTRGLIDRDKIALMKKTAILINTARGPIVDYTALGEALKKGRIQGAGLDVFEVEPPLPKDNPLFDAPNLVVTPHIGFATQEAMITRAEITIENIKKWLDGNPQNVIL